MTSTKGADGAPPDSPSSASTKTAGTAMTISTSTNGSSNATSTAEAGAQPGKSGYKSRPSSLSSVTNTSDLTDSDFPNSPHKETANEQQKGDPVTTMAGKTFSSDVGESRVIEIPLIQRDVLLLAVEQIVPGDQLRHIVQQVLSTASNKGSDWISPALLFDDLRIAKTTKEYLTSSAGCKTHFMPVDQYIKQHLRALGLPPSTVVGLAQFEIVAVFTGDVDSNSLPDLVNSCIELAKSFGKLRNHTTLTSDKSTEGRVRVEYHKMSDGMKLTDSTGLNHANEIDKNVLITVKYWQLPTKSTALSERSTSPSSRVSAYAYHSTPPTLVAGGFKGKGTMSAVQVGEPFVGQSREIFEMMQSQVFGPPNTRSSFTPEPATLSRGSSSGYDSPSSAQRPYRQDPRSIKDWRQRAQWSEDAENRAAQVVSIVDIELGHDVRATFMIRNIPNRLNLRQVYDLISPYSKGAFDFMYIRMDFANGCNVGYGFINFVRPELAIPMIKALAGKRWPGVLSDKIFEVSYATAQGLESLLQKFRNSSVMSECPDHRPKVFYHIDSVNIPEGKKVGDEAPFPKPDNIQKLHRSHANAQVNGLYPPRAGGRGRLHARGGRSQYDRGTPGALRDEAMAAGYYSDSSYQYGPARAGYAGRPVGSAFGPIAPPALPLSESFQSLSLATPRYVPNAAQAYRAAQQSTVAAAAARSHYEALKAEAVQAQVNNVAYRY